MQPAQPLATLVAFLSFCGGILVLAVSPERWRTFKKMLLAFITIAFVLAIVGLAVASLLSSIRILVADLTGTLCFSVGLLGAALTGWHHVRSVNNPKN
jgi:hypothetical protein